MASGFILSLAVLDLTGRGSSEMGNDLSSWVAMASLQGSHRQHISYETAVLLFKGDLKGSWQKAVLRDLAREYLEHSRRDSISNNAINSSLLCVSCFLAQPRCCLLFLFLEEGTNATQALLTTEKIHPVTGPLLFHSVSQALSCRDCSTPTSPPSKGLQHLVSLLSFVPSVGRWMYTVMGSRI